MALPIDVLQKSLNQKMILLLKDGRVLEGTLSGYDEHMNLVLEDTEERMEETRKKLGTVIIRGSNVVSISVA
ncbi:MAG: RNA-binding protein [Thermoplasmata archaeon]|nr:MAG: RNA-binding protein [Thermoplasmata archaeon]MCD6542756.1 RNA-binding protein [Thermoplasmata archaeon]RKX50043.1 MAG: RNA-binding protein [Thermotogota bacterium]